MSDSAAAPTDVKSCDGSCPGRVALAKAKKILDWESPLHSGVASISWNIVFALWKYVGCPIASGGLCLIGMLLMCGGYLWFQVRGAAVDDKDVTLVGEEGAQQFAKMIQMATNRFATMSKKLVTWRDHHQSMMVLGGLAVAAFTFRFIISLPVAIYTVGNAALHWKHMRNAYNKYAAPKMSPILAQANVKVQEILTQAQGQVNKILSSRNQKNKKMI